MLLCGAESKWKRRYRPEAFAGGRVKRYEGKPVYLDHDDSPRKAGRRFADKLGWVENARLNDRGLPVGDIGVNPKHPQAESVLWAAEHKPSFFGMSHVADIDERPGADGWTDVRDVIAVESVDVVSTPATTKGVFEGSGKGGRTVATIREALGRVLTSRRAGAGQVRRARRLAEAADAADLMDAPVDDTGGGDPDDAIDGAFEAAGVALWKAFVRGDLDLAALIAKIRELAKAHGNVSDAGGGADDDQAAEGAGRLVWGGGRRPAGNIVWD